MPRAHQWIAFTLALFFGLTSGLESIEAQRSRGGSSRFFGGGGRGDGGMMSVVRQDAAVSELRITEEQKEKIRELLDRSRQPTPELAELYPKLRDVSDEERTALFAKIGELRNVQRKKTEAELKQIISQQQFARLQQLTLHTQGIRALRQDEVAADLKLDDAQKAKIKAIYDDIQKQQSEIYASMRNLPREERRQANTEVEQKREKMRKEAEQKVLGLLTDTQKQSWQKKLGPPPVALAQNDGQPKPTSEAPAKPTEAKKPAAQPVDTGTTVNADGTEEKKEVVTSFASNGKGHGKDGQPKQLSFNFQYSPWSDVLKLFADAAGLTLDLDTTPPGSFTYFDKGKYTPTEALDVLNGALLQRGFIMVRRDEALVVMSLDDPIPPNLIPKVSVSELENRGKNELLSIVLPLEGLDPAAAAEEIQALLGPQGNAVALSKINRLVVTDIGSNLIRVVRLLGDVPVGDGRLFKAFPLKHIAAEDAEDIVRDLFGLSARGVQNVSQSGTGASSSSSGSRFQSSRFGSSRFQDPRFASRTPSRTPTTTSSSSRQPNSGAGDDKVNVSIDPRTNSLLVTAPPAEMKIVEQSIQAVDVEATSDIARSRRNNEPYLEVYQLNSADAVEVAKTLGVLYPGSVVNEDGRARRLHVFATPELHKEIANVIRRLDGEGGGSTVAVVQLGRIDSYTATATLQSLFLADRENAPTIQPHPVANALLVRGTNDQVTQIKTLIAQMMPEGGIGIGGGRIRTLNLNGRSAEDFVEMLEKVWGQSESNPIRVVIPSNRGAIRERRFPARGSSLRPERYEEIPQPPPAKKTKDTAAPDTRTERNSPNTEKPNSFASVAPLGKARTIRVSNALNQEEKSSAEPLPRKTPGKQESPIVITINGGNLVIMSDDEEALDRFEQMFQNLAQALPARQTWTLFYLSSADAMDTASLLERLLPDSSVSTGSSSTGGGLFGDFTGGLSSMGRGLMDMSGLSSLGTGPMTLRIIPNTRTNSLFVSGPAAKVQKVADMLVYLDASETPEQLRERAPRNIEVLHANVSDVAQIVQDVYKDYMQGSSQQNGGGQNPLAMLMGGRGGRSGSSRGGNSQQREIRLTLGIDTRTNMLVVSASDALFQQVEGLVRSLDDAALAANRTVRVQKLKNVNSAVMQEALISLVPKVQVSTTGQTRTSNGSSRSGPSAGGSQDQMREFFMQRMRERMMQQGGSQRGSSQRGSSGFRPGSSSGFGRGGSGGRGD